MKGKNKKQGLILFCSLLFLFLWQAVVAIGAAPYEVEVLPVEGAVANVVYTAGETLEQDLTMVIKDVDADDLDNVVFTFPSNYFTITSASANGVTATVVNNVVTFDKIPVSAPENSPPIHVDLKIRGNQSKVTETVQTENVTVRFGGGTGKIVPVTVRVEAAVIDVSRTTLEVTYNSYNSNDGVNQSGYAFATVVAKFVDQYGNVSNRFPANQEFYLAANGAIGFADIVLASGGATDNAFDAVALTGEDATADRKYYALHNLAADGTATFQVKGKLGSIYTFRLGRGNVNVTSGATIETNLNVGQKVELNYALASLSISGLNVNTHNEGVIRIDLSFPNYDLTGKTVEIKLPANFLTTLTNDNGCISLPAGASSIRANVVSVPGAGTYDYVSTSGGFALYIDEQEYALTNFNGCSIIVAPAALAVEIDNELDYRHGVSDAIPSRLKFTISGMDADQVNQIVFQLPEATTTSTSIKFDRTGLGTVSGDGSRITVFSQIDRYGKQSFDFPVVIESLPVPLDSLNKVFDIEIVTTKSSGEKVEQSNGLRLRYRVTDAVIEASQTEFSEIVSAPAENNQCAVELSVYLKDKLGQPETELNGRGLYVWITDENGKTVDIKDRFDIRLINNSGTVLKLINTEVGIAEGNDKGDRNVFRIYNTGDSTNVSSIEAEGPNLSTSTLDFRIVSIVNGTFKLNIGTGRNAKEALENSENEGSNYHAASDTFVFVSENERPILNIRNNGDIFYNYAEAGLEKPGPGKVVVEIDNVKFPEDPTKEDNIYLKLPEGLMLDPQYMEQGYLRLNRRNMEATSSTHYRTEIAVESITDELLAGVRDGENLILDGTQFTYYRGAAFNEKVHLAVNITSDLLMRHFVAYLNQFMQISFGEPAYSNTDIALNVAPITTGSGYGYRSKTFEQSTGAVLWFSTVSGNAEIVTADQMTFKVNGVEASVWSEENNNKFLLPWADGMPGQLGALAVQFKEVGQYQLNLALYQQQEDGPIVLDPVELKEAVNVNSSVTTLYSMVTVTEEPVTPPEPEDSWLLNLQVDGSSYTDNNHVYTVTGKKIGEKIAVQGTLTDKSTGAGLAGVKVTASGSAWTYTGDASTVTTDNGVFNFVVAAENVGTPHLLTLTMEDAITTSYSIQITVNDPSIVDSEDNYTLRKIKTVTPVALDRMAAVYLEAYDRNDDKIEITSNSMAENMFKSLRFSSIPDRSSLSSSDIIVRARNGGIEVYFYPDYRGSYYLRMETNSTGEQVLSASIDAIVQNTARSMDLIYPETTLGIGKTSSPARILTYDNNGVEAEEALNGSGWTYYYTGNGVASMDSWGRVTLKKDDRYIGSTVTVTVVNERLGLSDSYTFNIDASSSGDSSGTSSNISGIVLPDDYGAIGQTNQYQFYLVDRQGFTVELADGQMNSSNGAEARVTVSSKPYNASVDAYISSNGVSLEDNGYGYLYVSSSKEGTVRLNISLKIYNPERTEKNNYRYKQYDYYTKSVAITFKENAAVNTAISEDKTMISQSSTPVYDKSVAIFLGTNQYRVNMNERVGDAVPFIQNDRIMVPIRTISEGVGANVEFDDNTQIIEMKLDQDWVYAQVGSNIIRTNYGNLYSEVMPVIINGRTFLPLRTAAEALGCNVEAVYDVQGNTIGAVFMK